MSRSGSPDTTMTSASKPGASVPIVDPILSDSAASDVALTSASEGPCPARTRATISRAFCPWAPATASVPSGIFRPAASAFLKRPGSSGTSALILLNPSGVKVLAELVAALEVVLQHQADVRIEVHAVRGHGRDGRVVGVHAVLDFVAIGREGREDGFGTLRVHERAQARDVCLAARRRELVRAKAERQAAVAGSTREDDLDQIGAGAREVPHLIAQLVR